MQLFLSPRGSFLCSLLLALMPPRNCPFSICPHSRRPHAAALAAHLQTHKHTHTHRHTRKHVRTRARIFIQKDRSVHSCTQTHGSHAARTRALSRSRVIPLSTLDRAARYNSSVNEYKSVYISCTERGGKRSETCGQCFFSEHPLLLPFSFFSFKFYPSPCFPPSSFPFPSLSFSFLSFLRRVFDISRRCKRLEHAGRSPVSEIIESSRGATGTPSEFFHGLLIKHLALSPYVVYVVCRVSCPCPCRYVSVLTCPCFLHT